MQAAPTGGGRSSFAVAGASYDRFMGRYSARLAPAFADFAGIDGQCESSMSVAGRAR